MCGSASSTSARKNCAWRPRAAALLFGSDSLSRSFALLADCLEHPEAIVALAHEALVDQRCERLKVGCADRLGLHERCSAGESAEPPKQCLLVDAEKVVAPPIVARRVCCRSGASRVPPACGQPPLESLEQGARGHHPDARGGEPNRERQVVEARADLPHLAVCYKIASCGVPGRRRARQPRFPATDRPRTPIRPRCAAARGSSREL